MNTFWILLEQIGLFVIYIAAGVILVKTKVLNEQTLDPFSRFVLKMALPLMIFTNTISGVDREILLDSLPILGITVVFYICTFSIGKGMARLFSLKGDKAQVYNALTMFGNIGFMGIPIITSIFPENGMLYISVFTIIDQLSLWTIGVKLTTPAGEGKFNPRKLINPSTVAIVLAVACILLDLSLPPLLNTALTKIGSTATPLAMIYLGGVFACIQIRTYIRMKELYGITLFKMLLFPIVFYLLLTPLPISPEIHLTLPLLAAMPSMSSIVMMAKASGSEGDYAMGGIFVTTVCSMITLPAVCWFLQTVLA